MNRDAIALSDGIDDGVDSKVPVTIMQLAFFQTPTYLHLPFLEAARAFTTTILEVSFR